MADGPLVDALPDVVFTVHELQLEPSLLQRLQSERRPHVWVSADPLGLADELGLRGMRSRRVRAVHTTVGLTLVSRVPVEPSEPIWEPIMEALRSEEEQDSDVYFVLKAADSPDHLDDGGLAGIEECSLAIA